MKQISRSVIPLSRGKKLGLDKNSLSDGVNPMVGNTAIGLSFRESSLMIENLADNIVIARQIERVSETLGFEIAEDVIKT